MTASDATTGQRATTGPGAGRPVVELRDVVAVLGRFPALAGATLTVHEGEVLLLQRGEGPGAVM